MGPDEDSTRPAEEQEHGPAASRSCRPRAAGRARHCLRKGCERRFDPRRADQRYCSEEAGGYYFSKVLDLEEYLLINHYLKYLRVPFLGKDRFTRPSSFPRLCSSPAGHG